MLTSLALLSMAAPPKVRCQSTVEEGIRQAVLDQYASVRESLVDTSAVYSSEGALSFWSSGGLLQEVGQQDAPERFDSYSVFPKHIQVIPLSENSGVAQFYAEGSYKPMDGDPVAHYLTRATHVYVLEGGLWKLRAVHFSPVLGGSGTHATSVK
jgi:hypothetical protein